MEKNEKHDDSSKVVELNQNIEASDSTLSSKKRDIIQLTLYAYALVGLGAAIVYTASLNPEIFTLHKETLGVITEAYNLIVLLLVPMFFGVIGATSRVLLSGLKAREHFKLIFSSGLIATFSWLGIKSKVFLALLSPYIANSQLQGSTQASEVIKETGSEIYSMVLVAVLVGMFASNIYIFINQRVEQLTSTKS
ncbi:TPA: hypothetical protein ACPJ0P_004663 [Vibrio alginolyticus]|uniref:hypothetical protein n=1 Tax=Vibrio alginolyticus TaxID=663 RepID=UPI001D37639F|nr:hypothetical protein [Vibrio alginolyticus]EGR1564693.1 hypothetical protein [Vibrio alginolyticus]EHA1101006.1 hypothetical protein [Vibrio alginolyticus]EHA1123170.1 hypothetical protein [Vibrio alginolyticus]HDM8188365.1 hypothetical protein [Vibrio harveyi]